MSDGFKELCRRYGEPEWTGNRYVWRLRRGGSQDEIHFKPGWRYAYDKQTGQPILKAPIEHHTHKVFKSRLKDPAAMREFIASLELCPMDDLECKYLKARGWEDEEIQEWARVHPDFRDRVIFPIVEDGVMVAYQSRLIYDYQNAYKGAPTQDGWMPSHETCWGLDRLIPGKPAYLCEGIFDALYFPYGVAHLGSKLHNTQVVKVLDRKPSRIVLVLDRDDPDTMSRFYDDRLRVIKLLNSKIDVEFVLPEEDSKDFGDEVMKGRRMVSE